ncbi:MAG: 1-acyl-sn-glycerol-3-phosphate acyltransferase [Deltaproteobacteria bacterium]|nr:1-acyl-sn-glycerol-3-phosphate acyltransferase [Deltaproteobacteria bacterium]
MVYVARARSTWLVLYFNHALNRLGLPLARFVAGKSLLFWQPVGRLLRLLFGPRRQNDGAWRARYLERPPTRGEATLAELAARRQAVFLALHEGAQRRPTPDDYLRALVAAQRTSSHSIYLVPHALADRAQSGSPRTGLRDFLSGTRRRPGQRRELKVPHRRATVRVGDAIDLAAFVREHADSDDLMLARRLRHELDRRISEEERVVAGPELPRFDMVARHVLRDAGLREVIAHEAQASGKSPQAVETRAQRLLNEIAARYNVSFVKLLARLFDWVFNRIYDGIVVDARGLARAVEASRHGPLVLCPSHRSHVDYLVLSYVLWQHGVAPPHIAAGANLSFFPLGSIFRRGGAFFLRRTFKDDALYAAVFRAYVCELIRQGTAIEFFLEGTRSRTGKVLMPRFGLLGMLVDAWRRGERTNLQFVPVSIDYERIIEAGAYERELKGGEKRQEDLSGLLKTTRVLRSRYGRVHVQFGDPIGLAALAERKGLPQSAAPEHDSRWRAEVERLGYRIMHQVAAVCSVTPTAVAATALLGHAGRGLSQGALVARTHDIVEYLDAAAARLSPSVANAQARVVAVLEAVQKFVEEGHVVVEHAGAGDPEPIYRVPDERRVLLDFYKNMLMNYFAPAAIVCRSLMRRGLREARYADLHKDSRFLSRLFKREFLYRADSDFDTYFDDSLASLAIRGLVDVHEDGRVAVREPATVALIGGLLDGFVQAYYAAAGTLTELRDFPLWHKELALRAMERARRAYLEGRLSRPESAGRTLAESAVSFMLSSGIIEEQRTGRKATLRLAKAYDGQELEALIDEIAAFI